MNNKTSHSKIEWGEQPNKINEKIFNDSYIQWLCSPNTICELLKIKDFIFNLTIGNIFLHNKNPSFCDLINNYLSPTFEKFEPPIYFKQHKIIDSNSLKKIQKELLNSSNTKHVLILEKIEYQKNFFNLLQSMLNSNNLGLLVCGNIGKMLKLNISNFDNIFLFDTSNFELEQLKSIISIKNYIIKQLRNSNCNIVKENVLFFHNYLRSPKVQLLDENPKILGEGINREYSKEKPLAIKNQIINNGGTLVMNENKNAKTYDFGNNNNLNGVVTGHNSMVEASQELRNSMNINTDDSLFQTLELEKVVEELNLLKEMFERKETKTSDDYRNMAEISDAIDATNNKDESKFLKALKNISSVIQNAVKGFNILKPFIDKCFPNNAG